MNGIDEEVEEKKDHSRPFFPRKAGEVGVYVDVDELTCKDSHAYGSDHLMRVEMNDKLGEQLTKRDLVKFKGELERRGHFRGAILEEFRRGNILAVIFDSVEALQDLWKLHQGNQLSSLFQSLLVDKALLDAMAVRKLTLRVRMWPDEMEDCQIETLKMLKDQKRVAIKSRPRDVAILRKLQQYQKDAGAKLREQLQDAVAEFDINLSPFLLEVKQALPQRVSRLASLREFQTNMKMFVGADTTKRPKDTPHVNHYLATLDLLRAWVLQAEANLCLPLLLIPECCETERQRKLKRQMRTTCTELQKLLKPTNSLKEVRFREWEGKVTAREKELFLGLVSLPPLALDRVTDVDQSADEYINDFPPLS